MDHTRSRLMKMTNVVALLAALLLTAAEVLVMDLRRAAECCALFRLRPPVRLRRAGSLGAGWRLLRWDQSSIPSFARSPGASASGSQYRQTHPRASMTTNIAALAGICRLKSTAE